MSEWAAAVKARGVADVAAALGLTVRGRSPTAMSVSPCPACHAPRRGSSDPRGPVGLTADGLGWICHRCQVKGDAVTLAAIVSQGASPAHHDAAGWHAVAAFCEHHGLYIPETGPPRPAPPRSAPAPTVPTPTPRRERYAHLSSAAPTRPPEAEVRRLWSRCERVTDDADVRAWLEHRKLDADLLTDRDLVRALPRTGPLPAWCQYRGRSWRRSSHRVIVPLYGAGGRMESLHTRAIAPATPKDKAASPRGAQIGGLVMADALGRVLLAGAMPLGTGRVIVAEGVPDFLVWATHYGDAAEEAPPVLGVIAGSWTPTIAATIPAGWTVLIRTHADAAGDKYAEAIRASLAGRCVCKRARTRVAAYARMEIGHDA